MNIKLRFKHKLLMVALAVIILATVLHLIGITTDEIQAWQQTALALVALVAAVYAAIIDPTTPGSGDSEIVLNKSELEPEVDSNGENN